MAKLTLSRAEEHALWRLLTAFLATSESGDLPDSDYPILRRLLGRLVQAQEEAR